jgi:hypothetical protein
MKIRATDQRKYIEIIIGRELESSPLEGTEGLFVKYGSQVNVDPLLAIAISYHESRYCQAYAGWHNEQYHNCSGIMNGGEQNGLVKYQDWDAYIKSYMELLSHYVYDQGRDTISEIGSRYAPTTNYINRSWNGGVYAKYSQLWKKVESETL